MKKPAARIWIVGKLINLGQNAWEFQGAFWSKGKAVAACRTADYFVGPATMNAPLPDERTGWDGAFYPLGQ